MPPKNLGVSLQTRMGVMTWPSSPGPSLYVPTCRSLVPGKSARKLPAYTGTRPGRDHGVVDKQLPTVTAISDMVAPVVLITVGVIMTNALLSTYTVLADRIRGLRREQGSDETDRQLATLVRRIRLLQVAMLLVFGGIALFIGAVVWIAIAEAYSSETFGAVAVWHILAGLAAMLVALVVVALAYRTQPLRAARLPALPARARVTHAPHGLDDVLGLVASRIRDDRGHHVSHLQQVVVAGLVEGSVAALHLTPDLDRPGNHVRYAPERAAVAVAAAAIHLVA